MDDLPTFDADTLLATVNNRLARALLQRHAAAHRAAGEQIWETPRILSWNAWLRGLYDELVDRGLCARALLDPHQESLLWEDVIAHAERDDPLLDVPACARSARQAWQLLHDWRLPPEVLTDQPEEEAARLLLWMRRLRGILDREGWLTPAELPGALLAALEQAEAPAPPRRLLLAGFDQFTPVQEVLIERLRAQGCTVEPWSPRPLETTQVRRLPCADTEAECRAAAAWAHARLAHDPAARLAIVSPALSAHRERLVRWLNRWLDPTGLLPGERPSPRFDISLGRPLADWPVVADLLRALRLSGRAELPLAEIGALLRSPFFDGAVEEHPARAALDRLLREEIGRPRLDRRTLLTHARRASGDAACPRLIERLEAVQQVLDALSGPASPNERAGHLLQLFAAWGWPGEPRRLDSAEYQQVERLRQAVSDFSRLARVRRHMTIEQTLERFARLCRDIDYQPRRPTAGRVQVLGVLEAAGQRFDGLWLLGLDDTVWPPAPDPNPLLPVALQRRHDMPHASAARELRFARLLTERLLASAPEVWISHANSDDDRKLAPSPLIAGIAEAAPDFALDDPLGRAAAQGATSPLPLPESLPPAMPPRGGSRLLADQSACPFRALAHHRLGARPLEEPGLAPSPALLGDMLHRLLEAIWGELGDSEGLARQSDEVLRERLRQLATAIVNELGRDRPDLFRGPLGALEVERLSARALEWLDYERRRPAPFRVERREARETPELAGLPLRLRADRVDVLPDGRRIVIDYKTGRNLGRPDWEAERLPEPQVPLYAVHLPEVAGAVLAHIQPDGERHRFLGCCASDDLLPRPGHNEKALTFPEDWPALLDDWRRKLETLAHEVLDGRVDIAPIDHRACTHCGLEPLCRVTAATDEEDTA